MGIVDELKDLFNTRGSKRRSRLGVGIAKWDEKQSWEELKSKLKVPAENLDGSEQKI